MGRKLDKIATVRLSEHERNMFQLTCKQTGTSSQELLRNFILKFIKENVVK